MTVFMELSLRLLKHQRAGFLDLARASGGAFVVAEMGVSKPEAAQTMSTGGRGQLPDSREGLLQMLFQAQSHVRTLGSEG